MSDNGIKIIGIEKEYQVNGKSNRIFDGLNLEIKSGEFISIIGHSGCGKSTLIRIIAGLEEFQGGKILINGVEAEEPDTRRGMVFQDHRLLPWLTIYDNLGFGYYESDSAKKKQEIIKHLELVGLQDYAKAYPNQLSGGMSQRASIARALLHNPKVLLLDEPFGALDALTRMQMQSEILRIWKEEKTTMILVTHDIDEAIYLSDRIVILDGKPASIKKIIDVEMGRPRMRTGYDFSETRRRIYKEFFGEEEIVNDYFI